MPVVNNECFFSSEVIETNQLMAQARPPRYLSPDGANVWSKVWAVALSF